jgi:hypothetical protein
MQSEENNHPADAGDTSQHQRHSHHLGVFREYFRSKIPVDPVGALECRLETLDLPKNRESDKYADKRDAGEDVLRRRISPERIGVCLRNILCFADM